jgi:short-subunit dehydrogenase
MAKAHLSIITGASQGFGVHIALSFAAAFGGDFVLASRNVSNMEAVSLKVGVCGAWAGLVSG